MLELLISMEKDRPHALPPRVGRRPHGRGCSESLVAIAWSREPFTLRHEVVGNRSVSVTCRIARRQGVLWHLASIRPTAYRPRRKTTGTTGHGYTHSPVSARTLCLSSSLFLFPFSLLLSSSIFSSLSFSFCFTHSPIYFFFFASSLALFPSTVLLSLSPLSFFAPCSSFSLFFVFLSSFLSSVCCLKFTFLSFLFFRFLPSSLFLFPSSLPPSLPPLLPCCRPCGCCSHSCSRRNSLD